MTGAAPPGHSLLAVFAHPDDESLASGGLLAWCAARGVRVSLLCLTRGGLGLPDDPARLRIGVTRGRELQAAAGVLGLHEVILLDYRNGFLPWEDRASLDSDIHRAITRLAPDVVVTFDDDGLYWHPDHIVVHERTTAVVAALGDRAPALFYASMPIGCMRAALDAAGAAALREGRDPPASPDVLGVPADAFGLFTTPATLIVDASAFAAQKLAALRCHRSQVDGDPLDALPEDQAPRVLGVEHYRRSGVGARGDTFVDGLGRAAAATGDTVRAAGS